METSTIVAIAYMPHIFTLSCFLTLVLMSVKMYMAWRQSSMSEMFYFTKQDIANSDTALLQKFKRQQNQLTHSILGVLSLQLVLFLFMLQL